MLTEMQNADRIARNPKILQGKPIISGTRVPVYLIVDLIQNGSTPEQIVEDYPELTLVDV